MTRPLEVLLVEDNQGDIEMTRRALRNADTDCNLSVAHDGVQGLEFLRKGEAFTDAANPDIILLDINMPRMDGKRFLELTKSDTQLRTIPVIMFTSSQSPEDIRDCYERQASCYVVKPFEMKAFTSALVEVVHFWGAVGKVPSRG